MICVLSSLGSMFGGMFGGKEEAAPIPDAADAAPADATPTDAAAADTATKEAEQVSEIYILFVPYF